MSMRELWGRIQGKLYLLRELKLLNINIREESPELENSESEEEQMKQVMPMQTSM